VRPVNTQVSPRQTRQQGGGITLKSLRRIERAQTQMVATEIRLRTFAKLYGVPEVWLYAGDLAGPRVRPFWYAPEANAA